MKWYWWVIILILVIIIGGIIVNKRNKAKADLNNTIASNTNFNPFELTPITKENAS